MPSARVEAARPLVAQLGHDHPVVRGLGLSMEPPSDRRLPVTALDVLWEALVERDGPTAPLVLAHNVRASSYGLLTYSLGCAPSGHDALRRLGRTYRDLLSEGTGYEVSADRRHVVVAIALHGSPRTAAATLFAASSVVGFTAAEVEGHPRPVEVRLDVPPPPPREADAFRRFFGGPIHFTARPSRLVYARASLDRRLHGSDSALCEILDEAVARRRPAPRPVAESTREVLLAARTGQYPPQAEVAALLGLSPRVLRRRLAHEGTSFQLVLDGVRRRWAEAWLAEPGTRVAELAQRLGYADAAAFRRAFRRWTGMSPSAWAALTRRRAQPR